MSADAVVSRRSVIAGAAGAAAAGLVGSGLDGAMAASSAVAPPTGTKPLWVTAYKKGIVFGTAWATWQEGRRFNSLVNREAAILFTQDDLLWYVLKPTPDSPLDFSYADRLFARAERQGMLVFAAHLVWDEGFGEGWTDDDLWGLSERNARKLLFGTARAMLRRYRGRVAGWIVANEVTDPEGTKNGIRTNVPWYNTIGPSYIDRCFEIAQRHDPKALRVLNEFGFETVNEYGDTAESRRRAFLKALDHLLGKNVPIQAVGIQGHLLADQFHQRFHEKAYRRFLQEFQDRGLKILITEMDVLDEGLVKAPKIRDRKVADVYRHYLDVTLDETAVKVVNCFGLTDRYTWLDEDNPRSDGAHRRPLLFDQNLKVKPAYFAVSHSFRHAPKRNLLWQLRKRPNY